MKTLTAVSALALLASIAPATAADIYSSGGLKDVAPIVAPIGWTGFYLGVNGGYGQNASSRDTTLFGDASAYEGYPDTFNGHVLGAAPSGFLFGGQAGYLAQYGSFVFGAEAAFNGSNITGDKTSDSVITETYTPAGTTFTDKWQSPVAMHQQLDYVGALTGVAGVALGNAMVYAKAGLAFGQVQESVGGSDLYFGNMVMGSRTATDTGYTAGAGIAYKFTPNWSISFEGDYYDLGSHSISFVDNYPVSYGEPAITYHAKVSEDFWAAKAALNYQVGSVYVPLK